MTLKEKEMNKEKKNKLNTAFLMVEIRKKGYLIIFEVTCHLYQKI